LVEAIDRTESSDHRDRRLRLPGVARSAKIIRGRS
jgi:hypothetical protein